MQNLFMPRINILRCAQHKQRTDFSLCGLALFAIPSHIHLKKSVSNPWLLLSWPQPIISLARLWFQRGEVIADEFSVTERDVVVGQGFVGGVAVVAVDLIIGDEAFLVAKFGVALAEQGATGGWVGAAFSRQLDLDSFLAAQVNQFGRVDIFGVTAAGTWATLATTRLAATAAATTLARACAPLAFAAAAP